MYMLTCSKFNKGIRSVCLLPACCFLFVVRDYSSSLHIVNLSKTNIPETSQSISILKQLTGFYRIYQKMHTLNKLDCSKIVKDCLKMSCPQSQSSTNISQLTKKFLVPAIRLTSTNSISSNIAKNDHRTNHCVKNVRIRTFSGSYIPAFRLNTSSVFSPNAGKYEPEKSEYRHFSGSVYTLRSMRLT